MTTTTEIPYDINDSFAAGWWKPMAVDGDNTYIAYTSTKENDYGRHHLNLAKRDSLGAWTNYTVMSTDYPDDWGHNQTSVAVDGDGRVHIFNSIHHNRWTQGGGHYFRTDNTGDVTTLTDCSSEMPDDSNQFLFTYPIVATHPSGDLYMVARRYDTVILEAPLYLYRWDNANSTWIIKKQVANQSAKYAWVYPDSMIITDDGMVHIAFSWHENEASSLRHYGSYILYNPSNNNCYTADGVLAATPLSWTANNLVYQPLAPGETSTGDEPEPGHQTASIAVDSGGTVSIAYRYRYTSGDRFAIKRARYNAGWQREVVVNGPLTFAALGISHDGTTVRIYYVQDIGGPIKLHEASKSTGQSVWSDRRVTETNVQRIQLVGNTLYASSPQAQKQYLIGEVV